MIGSMTLRAHKRKWTGLKKRGGKARRKTEKQPLMHEELLELSQIEHTKNDLRQEEDKKTCLRLPTDKNELRTHIGNSDLNRVMKTEPRPRQNST